MQKKEVYPKVYLYKRIVQAKLFIDTHFAEKIDLNNIADEAYFSKYHFIRLFHDTYKRTPHQYLSFVRLEKAKEFLKNGLPVAQACYAVGFESAGSFTTLFKRSVGQTPSAYQAAALQQQADVAKAPLNYIPNCFAEKNGWVKHRNFEEVGE